MMSDFKPEHLEAARMALLGVEFSHPAILDLVERNIAEGFADLEATVEARVRRELPAWTACADSLPDQAGMYLCSHPEHGLDVILFTGKAWGKTSFWNHEDPSHWMWVEPPSPPQPACRRRRGRRWIRMAKTERGQRAYEDRHERAADELVGDLLIDVEVEVANGIHERLAAGIAALEQACAVTAVAERGGGAVEAWKLANGYDDLLKAYSEAVSASARRRELLSRVYMWRGSGLPSGLWRDLETELNGPKAEAGKAQAEGWQACRHGYMPRAGEKVMFWCRGWLEGATPGIGAYNGDFWEDETQTDGDGAFKLIPGSEVTHWTTLLPSPPSSQLPAVQQPEPK
jgi:hypothetical protein